MPESTKNHKANIKQISSDKTKAAEKLEKILSKRSIQDFDRQLIKELLPHGALREIQRRLKEKGIPDKDGYSYITVQSFGNRDVIDEALLLLGEMVQKKKKRQDAQARIIKKITDIGLY